MNNSQNKTWSVFSEVSLGLIMAMILLFLVSGSAQASMDTSEPENMGKPITSMDKEKILESESASTLIYQPYFNKAYYGNSSTLYLLNPSVSTAHVSLTFHDVSGNYGNFTGNYTIEPAATLALLADDISGLSSGGSYTLIISSDQPVASVVNSSNEVVTNDNFYSIGGMSTGSTTNVFTPFYDTSVLLLWNVGGSNANFSAYFFDLNGNYFEFTGAIPAGGRYTVYGPNIPGLPAGTYSAIVTSDQELVGVNVDYVVGYERYEFYQPLGTDISATYLPRALKAYAGQGGTITTIVYVTNLAAESTDATLNFYDSEGNSVDSTTLSIPGYGYRMVDWNSLNSLSGTGVWSVIATAAQPIALSEITSYVTTPIYPNGVYEGGTGTNLELPRITRSRENTTIISLQNPNDSTAEVSMDYYDLSGSQIFTETRSIPAHGWERIEQIQQPDLGNNFIGSVLIDSDLPVAALVDEYVGVPIDYDCAKVTEISSDECEALVALYNSTNGDDWTDNTNWLLTYTPCDWFGVTCEGGTVTRLNLTGNNLVGPLPASIGDLSGLQRLNLGSDIVANEANYLSGNLPPEIGDLSLLTTLNLAGNQLDGSIPVELGDLSNLQSLELSWNDFTGSIPSSLGGISSLTSLKIANNQLTGNLPPELGNLANLEQLWLNVNHLSGSIPVKFGDLGNLKTLSLDVNQLEGGLPAALGDLENLTSLRLRSNQFRGDIPAELVNLTSLNSIFLDYNALSATDPALIAFLNVLDPNWADTQTVPPSDLEITSAYTTGLDIAWTPINYTEDGGYYEVEISTQEDSGFIYYGHTITKTAETDTIGGLLPGTSYYVRLRSYTPAHDIQQNDLWSEFTKVVSGTTIASGAQASVFPEDNTTLTYTDTEGTEIVVEIPAGAVTEEVTIAYIPLSSVSESPDFEFAGQSFELNAYQDGVMIDGFTFQEPVTITLSYRDVDILGIDEDTLLLNYWNTGSSSWTDAAETCSPASEYERNPAENRLAVPVCHLSTFGLFGTKITEYKVFLPVSINP